MLEQILQLLPQPCMYTNKGCLSLNAANHSQYCEYRPIKCVQGSDYSCNWLGTVKDWINHVKNKHIVVDYLSGTNKAKTVNYLHFNSWIVRGSCHYFDDKYFIVLAKKKNGMLCETVRVVPLVKPNCQYFLETTIRNITSNDVLYRVILTAGLLLENDSFENNSTSFFALKDLNSAISQGNLVMSRKFMKQ